MHPQRLTLTLKALSSILALDSPWRVSSPVEEEGRGSTSWIVSTSTFIHLLFLHVLPLPLLGIDTLYCLPFDPWTEKRRSMGVFEVEGR